MFVLKFHLEKKYLSHLICLYTMHRRPNQSHYDATIARKEAIEIHVLNLSFLSAV